MRPTATSRASDGEEQDLAHALAFGQARTAAYTTSPRKNGPSVSADTLLSSAPPMPIPATTASTRCRRRSRPRPAGTSSAAARAKAPIAPKSITNVSVVSFVPSKTSAGSVARINAAVIATTCASTTS